MSNGASIVVMYGGFSAEREVSLRSGAAVAAALRKRQFKVTEMDIRDQDWTLPEGTDAVFLALHGAYGEDGTIQRRLDFLKVPYTGCDAESSRVAFDKLLTKLRCIQSNVPTPPYHVLASATDAMPEGLTPPLVLKPLRQGSSVGLQFVDSREAWSAAVTSCFQYDSEILVESRIVGRETTVGILEDKALPIVEVRPRRGAYDYANKYTAGATEYLCPAPFDEPVQRAIQEAALGAYHAVNARDYARVDVMVDQQNKPWVLEINTLPGMTETSLLPKAAAAAGLSYEALCERMVQLALQRKENA
ncbi:MAG TPA: D-alanine--D-alanine ligase [Methylomirabilota bacterium]|nr:D-alanine--D-alanine ligase [Methylomirabilota bacterium]